MSICSRLPRKGSPRGPGRSASSRACCDFRPTDDSANGAEDECPVGCLPLPLSATADGSFSTSSKRATRLAAERPHKGVQDQPREPADDRAIDADVLQVAADLQLDLFRHLLRIPT